MSKTTQPTLNFPNVWLDKFPFPARDAHKYDRGHALIRGGAIMTGATRLAARAAQRMGAGLVTLAVPTSVLPIYAESLESVIVLAADDCHGWQSLVADPKIDVLLIGPGLGVGAEQKECVLAALQSKKPCVLDADALNNFSDDPQELFAKLHEKCALTPHEGEFSRLFSSLVAEGLTKSIRAQIAAQKAKCVVLLKGADTYIASPDGRLLHNNNAPVWLATAGAGDVLAGIILGLLAQNMPIFEATAASAWIHGEIARNYGPGLIAEDIISGLPLVLKSLSQAIGIV